VAQRPLFSEVVGSRQADLVGLDAELEELRRKARV
jgi:hypothetical protein